MQIMQLAVAVSLITLSACTSSRPVTTAPVSTSSPAVTREATAVQAPAPPSVSEPGAARTPAPPEPAPEPAPERSPQPTTPASTLLASVDEAVAAGDLERAAALSERALRITPRDGTLWYRLASIRFQQRQYSDAEGFARRALSFAGSDRALTEQINQLLARISTAPR
jgi:tetratricopeptide (TPR) repeat protein